MYKETCQKHPCYLKKISQQRKLNPMKTRRSAILHFQNDGHRSPAVVSRITKTLLKIVKYNITKIKQQGTIKDRVVKVDIVRLLRATV